MTVTTTIPEKIRSLEEKYRHELLSEEARLELRELILRLKRKLAAVAAAR